MSVIVYTYIYIYKHVSKTVTYTYPGHFGDGPAELLDRPEGHHLDDERLLRLVFGFRGFGRQCHLHAGVFG